MTSSTAQILVADDESFSRMIVSRHLREIGQFEVLAVSDGGEALTKLTSPTAGNIKCVIADFNMPVLTGLQVLKAIRTGLEGIRRDTPVMLVTGHTDVGLVGAAVELDVDAFIAKPLSKATLEAKLRRVLQINRPIKTITEYGLIDANKDFLAMTAETRREEEAKVTMVPIEVEAKPPVPGARQFPLEAVPEGAILAADITLSDGTVVVKKGKPLPRVLIDKLLDLKALSPIPDKVWVTAPSPVSA